MDKIIFCIVQGILCPAYVSDLEHHIVVQTAEKLYRKIMGMPTLLRTLMIMVIYVFNWSGVFGAASFFENQDLTRRQKQLRQWQESKIGSCRDVAAFFTKMTLFIYFTLCPKKN